MEKSVSAIIEGLNDEQRRAVECSDGPVLIVAGAGSGKTRVLTSRIAYILAGGCESSRIMALTFTKKAATEMKERIAAMVGAREAGSLVMGTFHSVFIRFLREYAESLGYPKQFTIYDTSDSQSAVKACIKEMNLDDKIYKPKEVLSRISMAKNNLVTPSAYRKDSQAMANDTHSKKPHICDIYALYQDKLKKAGVMDFDDILLNMNVLLRDNPEALEAIAARFSYIMVDEYQDTNYSQYLILKKLAMHHRNICVVGDDSQSIYAFRGAKIENILNFKRDYPDSNTFRLERNYRSTSTIVDAANSLIAHNSGRIPKECYSMAGDGDKIKLIKAYTEQDEAESIVSDIREAMRRHRAQYQDFAVLYRTNAQSRAIEDRLRRWNIPYMVYSGNSFFDRAEVKDLMAYFKLVVNVNDDESFKRVVNKPARGIGDTSVSALNECARGHSCSLFKAAFCEDAADYGLKAAALYKIRAFCEMIGRMAVKVADTDALELAQQIAGESGILAFYKGDNSIEGQSRSANVEELVNSVATHVEDRQNEARDSEAAEDMVVTLDDYLENVSLLSNVDVSEDDDVNNKVALMTVHSAKGLEFPYVFVAGMEENLFPGGGNYASTSDIEEERRLFYVAITRAKCAVTLSFAGSRMRNGNHESNSPSRFIREIDSRYIANPLDEEDYDNTGVRHEWGGFGSRFTGGRLDRLASGAIASGDRRSSGPRAGMGGYRYGRSSAPAGAVSASRPTASPFGSAPRPAAASAPRPGTGTPDIIDPDFVAVDPSELYVGERIEHNRFGGGQILDIIGRGTEGKAKIVFDNFGEKLLLLKFAKLRPEKK